MGGYFIFFVFYFLFVFAIVVFLIIAQWKVYTKAGKPGWAVLIPIYNTIILLEIAGKEWWWIFLFMLPIVNIVIMIIVMIEISKAFGKTGGFAVGLILLPIVFWPILGFGKAKYEGNE